MIEIHALTKRYGQTTAVDDLTFDVRPGIVTGFLGPNGAGKSTTMRTVVGLDRPTSGWVRVNGHRYVDDRAPLTEVGALLEARSVHPGRSAFNHLLFLAQQRNRASPRERGPRAGGPGRSGPQASGDVLWGWASVWASPPPFSATPAPCSSTSPPTA